jgi:hypothetical protein
MDFIKKLLKKLWPWVTTAYELLTWFYKREWNLVISKVTWAYEKSLLEVSMPWWAVVLIAAIPPSLITLWSYRQEIFKKKPENVKFSSDDKAVFNLLLEASYGEKFNEENIAEELNITISEARKSLVWLRKYDMIEEDYEGYNISEQGVLVARRA